MTYDEPTPKEYAEAVEAVAQLDLTPKVQFGVIARVPDHHKDPTATGNLALALVYVEAEERSVANQYMGVVVPAAMVFGPGAALAMRAPVFVRGEILVCSRDGRELAGKGRKPDKWDVNVEWFDTIDKAVARALELDTPPVETSA